MKGNKLYEPYGFIEGEAYYSLRSTIDDEIKQNRESDKEQMEKSFTKVEFDDDNNLIVFRNAENKAVGLLDADEISPSSSIIEDVTYDKDTQILTIKFDSGKTIEVDLNDLINIDEAGDGLEIKDSKISIKIAEDSESFLQVTSDGIKNVGIQNAIDAEADRAIVAEGALNDLIEAETLSREQVSSALQESLSSNMEATSANTVSIRTINDNLLSHITDAELHVTSEEKNAWNNKLDESALNGYATEQWVESKGYLTEHQSLSGYATEQWVESKGYLTEHQDLSNYATIEMVDEKDNAVKALIPTVPTNVSAFVNDANYLTEHQSLSGYATEQWVESKGYLTEHQDISNLATKDEVNAVDAKVDAIDLTPYAIASDVNAALDLKADKTEIPTDFYTQEEVATMIKAKETEIYNLTKIVGELGGNVTYDLPNELGTSFNSLMNNNGTVKLADDVTTSRFGPGITAKNKVKLNLNNHNLTVTGLTLTSATAAVMARGTQEITITGKGTIDSGQGMCIEGNGADSIINLTGSTTVYQNDRSGGELVYCYAGTINITNGTFRNNGEDKKFVLNCYDANYRNGTAKIIVSGGKFYDFDPGDNSAEGEHTSFLAEGYYTEASTVVEEGVEHTVYTVKKA